MFDTIARVSLTAVMCLWLSLLGCRANKTAVDQSDQNSTAEIDRLRALGYIAWSNEEAVGFSGVQFDAERSYPGYNLYVNRNRCEAILMDWDGFVITTWRDDENCRYWSQVQLSPDGNLLVVGASNVADQPDWGPTDGQYVSLFSWAGEVIWTRNVNAHHDIEVLPDGSLLTLLEKYRAIPQYRQDVLVIDAFIATLSALGTPVESLSLYDLFTANKGVLVMLEKSTQDVGVGPVVDLFHPNSVELVRVPSEIESEHEMYRGFKVLVSVREHDTIIVVDWISKKLVWAWGPGELKSPHCATLLQNGNVLVFDNGLGRGYSRAVEVDPRSNEIVWQYKSEPPEEFYSAFRGSVQRLRNGNTLIAQSDEGRAFEVTPDGTTVWEWRNPLINEEKRRATIVRMQRLERDYVGKIFDLTGTVVEQISESTQDRRDQ